MRADGLASLEAGELHRVGRQPDAWAWPEWAYAGADGTFGNRYDDPDGRYRVLYASSSRFGAFAETLARFRPDLSIVAERQVIDGEEDSLAPGDVPAGWPRLRAVGRARVAGPFADVGHSRSLAFLRERLAAAALHFGVDEIDAAAIRMHVPRAFTQAISRAAYECADAEGGRQFVGVAYMSRLGDDLRNWAIFEPEPEEPSPVLDAASVSVEPADPDLARALRMLGLRLR